MAAERESTTVTRCSPTWAAASRAASHVPDSSARQVHRDDAVGAGVQARAGRPATKSPGVGPGGGDPLAADGERPGDVVRPDVAPSRPERPGRTT